MEKESKKGFPFSKKYSKMKRNECCSARMTGTEILCPSYNIRRWFWWWVTLCWERWAAFGLVSALWVLYGFLLPAERGGGLYAPARPGVTEDSFARRYLWLRELGLLREELTMVDFGISDAEPGLADGAGREGLRTGKAGRENGRENDLTEDLEILQGAISAPWYIRITKTATPSFG